MYLKRAISFTSKIVLTILVLGTSACSSLKGADLRNANLAGRDLAGKDISDADLSGAYLEDADLRDANLRNANLTNANLRNANLNNANLILANLSNANLNNANLNNANLRSANLSNADLSNASLIGAALSSLRDVSNFSGAVFEYANLDGVDFSDLDLSNMNLSFTSLVGADFRNAILSGANLSHAKLVRADLTGATLSGATLTGADLSEAFLNEAILTDVDFSDANLEETRLTGAKDFPVDVFSKAVSEKTELSGSVLLQLFSEACNGRPVPGAIDLENVSSEDKFVIIYEDGPKYYYYSDSAARFGVGNIRYVACVREPAVTLVECNYTLGQFDIERINAQVKIVDIRTGKTIANKTLIGEDPEVDSCPFTICIGICTGNATYSSDLRGDGVPGERIYEFIRMSLFEYLSWPVFRADTFDSNDNEWATDDFDTEFLSGSRLIRNGTYLWDVTSNQAGTGFVFLDSDPVSDFYLTVEVEAISDSQAYSQGLMFKAINPANFYLFALTGYGQYGVLLIENNQGQFLAGPSSSSAIRVGEVNQLAVRSEGTTLSFYINDTFLEELDDSKLHRSGRVGILAELFKTNDQAILYFDNFKISTPHADQQVLIESGRRLAQAGEIDEAMAIYDDVEDSESGFEIPAYSWNSLCWYGSLWGKPVEIMNACDNAVQIASETNPEDSVNYRDSRGLARALTGDYSGAIEDFQSFVEWYQTDSSSKDHVAQREMWIAELEVNQNPFDEATLAALRNE